jgi:hypothetical protein
MSRDVLHRTVGEKKNVAHDRVTATIVKSNQEHKQIMCSNELAAVDTFTK